MRAAPLHLLHPAGCLHKPASTCGDAAERPRLPQLNRACGVVSMVRAASSGFEMHLCSAKLLHGRTSNGPPTGRWALHSLAAGLFGSQTGDPAYAAPQTAAMVTEHKSSHLAPRELFDEAVHGGFCGSSLIPQSQALLLHTAARLLSAAGSQQGWHTSRHSLKRLGTGWCDLQAMHTGGSHL